MINSISNTHRKLFTFIFFYGICALGKPVANKTFGVSPSESQTNRLFAFNQGFYNLFLSIAIIIGIMLKNSNEVSKGTISLIMRLHLCLGQESFWYALNYDSGKQPLCKSFLH